MGDCMKLCFPSSDKIVDCATKNRVYPLQIISTSRGNIAIYEFLNGVYIRKVEIDEHKCYYYEMNVSSNIYSTKRIDEDEVPRHLHSLFK